MSALMLLAWALAVQGVAGANGAEPVAPPAPEIMYRALSRPRGEGPFAAVALLHGCEGFTPREFQWEERLRRWGYVTLLVSSFTPRDVRNKCSDPDGGPGRYADRVEDAYGALLHLRRQPFVDGGRIAVIGWAMGGGTVLRTVAAGAGGRFALPAGARFAAAVAFYPRCEDLGGYDAPLLVLIGGQDDWSPAARCEANVADRPAGAGRVRLRVYPEAAHMFDLDWPRREYRGHVLAYDAGAAADAAERVRAFLAEHL